MNKYEKNIKSSIGNYHKGVADLRYKNQPKQITFQYSSLYHNTLLKEMERRQEHYRRITNMMFGKVIEHQNLYITKFSEKLQKILSSNNNVYCSGAYSNWITVYSTEFADKYNDRKEIASINLQDNKIHFRRKGAPNVTKVIKFGRELTVEKVAKYILRFGTK